MFFKTCPRSKLLWSATDVFLEYGIEIIVINLIFLQLTPLNLKQLTNEVLLVLTLTETNNLNIKNNLRGEFISTQES